MPQTSNQPKSPVQSLCVHLEELRQHLERVYESFDALYRLVYQLKRDQESRRAQ